MKSRLAIAAGFAFAIAAVARAQAPLANASEPRPIGLTFSAAVDVPLSYDRDRLEGSEAQGEETVRSPRLSLSLRYQLPETYWFARVTLHRYLDPDRQAPWHPDFSYSFGYEDWHPGSFSLTYDNYGGNRFNPDRRKGEQVTHLEKGTVSAIYRIPVPRRIEAIFVPHPGNRLSATIGAHLTPRFHIEGSPEQGDWKRSVSFGVRNRVYRWWYVEGRAYWYPSSSQQQPWDPDYTYSFGWYDWHPGTVSLQYSNYAGNRFPGRTSARSGSFRDGAISVAWSHKW